MGQDNVYGWSVFGKAGGEYFVQCLEKPFGVNDPENLEKEESLLGLLWTSISEWCAT